MVRAVSASLGLATGCCACLILFPNRDPSAPAKVPTGLHTAPNGPDHTPLACVREAYPVRTAELERGARVVSSLPDSPRLSPGCEIRGRGASTGSEL